MSLRTPAWSIKRHACVPHSKEPVAKEQIYDCRHILHEHYDYGNRVNSMRKLDGGRTVVKRVHQQRKKNKRKYYLNRPIIRYAEVKPYFPSPLSNPFSNHEPTGCISYVCYGNRQSSTRLFNEPIKMHQAMAQNTGQLAWSAVKGCSTHHHKQ